MVISNLHLNLISVGIILAVSVLLSQFISNVPLVALYLPLLTKLGASVRDLMALAAGSTIAGNLSILGAASNIIIIQNAEKKANETLTFWEFIRIGIPLTAVNVLVYWLFFSII
jgi:Na+/H+ antiporter NhaD/arsenite permease-like protein